MSEAAIPNKIKRHWAEPGGRHDAVNPRAKFALPVMVRRAGGWSLAIAPFEKRDDVSFILDKNGVDEAHGTEAGRAGARRGEDNKAKKFVIVADRAVQQIGMSPL